MTRRRRFPYLANFLTRVSKRQKFVTATLFLALGLFVSQNIVVPETRIILVLSLSFLAALSLLIALYKDIKGTFWWPLLILPFFFTLSFGLFYFLLPARFLTRITLTTLFAIGLYALYLSHNIYAVAGIRTIQLLNAAHSVGFLLTLVIHFFLINIIFSLHVIAPLVFLLIFLVTFILIFPVLWSVNLEERVTKAVLIFTTILALVIAQLGLVLNFWPATPVVATLFLSGNFYTFVGLSQVWLERRVFKGTIWEYIGVAIIVFLVLVSQTKWGG